MHRVSDTKITLHYEFLEESILFGYKMNGKVFDNYFLWWDRVSDKQIRLYYEFLEESILFGFKMNGEVFDNYFLGWDRVSDKKNYITLWISRGDYPLWLQDEWRGFW